jgi:hypothetical protein
MRFLLLLSIGALVQAQRQLPGTENPPRPRRSADA